MTDYNKMKFLRSCQAICENNAKRLFSSKEMKDITKRNYSRCPEVQKKIVDNHERQLKVANRLMADTFNQKLRENVLKGKRNLPLDAKVVNLK
jgi:HD superfamily phosphohydrolase